jgi:hypothetical protein
VALRLLINLENTKKWTKDNLQSCLNIYLGYFRPVDGEVAADVKPPFHQTIVRIFSKFVDFKKLNLLWVLTVWTKSEGILVEVLNNPGTSLTEQ